MLKWAQKHYCSIVAASQLAGRWCHHQGAQNIRRYTIPQRKTGMSCTTGDTEGGLEVRPTWGKDPQHPEGLSVATASWEVSSPKKTGWIPSFATITPATAMTCMLEYNSFRLETQGCSLEFKQQNKCLRALLSNDRCTDQQHWHHLGAC